MPPLFHAEWSTSVSMPQLMNFDDEPVVLDRARRGRGLALEEDDLVPTILEMDREREPLPTGAGDDIKTRLPERSRQQELEGYLFLHQNEGDTPHRPGWDVDILKLERYKPIVAAVDGYCLGQGMLYLLHLTDLRVASTRAQFGLPEIAYGMGGGGGDMQDRFAEGRFRQMDRNGDGFLALYSGLRMNEPLSPDAASAGRRALRSCRRSGCT